MLRRIGIIVSAGPVYDASRLVLYAGEPGKGAVTTVLPLRAATAIPTPKRP